MSCKEYETLANRYLLSTYDPYPIALSRGQGATLYDTEGRAYLDFTAGIGVNALGHANAAWLSAIYEQAGKLAHTSNLYYTQPALLLAEQLCLRTGLAGAFFCNSGAEANEVMIKTARKYSFDRNGVGRSTILTLENSFHGRTITTLSASGQEKLHTDFFPFNAGFRHHPPEIAAFRSDAGSDVCAVLVEPILGEGGVLPLSRDFLQDLAVLCAERGWLLLLDEVQTGIGRTGTLFAFQQYGIAPDIVSFAKGIGGGLPLGGILCGNRCRDTLTPGSHGSTFGGNPVCCAGALSVLDQLTPELLAEVEEKGAFFRAELDALSLPELGKSRGLGLMIGASVVGERSNRELVSLLAEAGLLCLTAGQNSLRFLPPLTITRQELMQGLQILRQVLA